MKTKRLLSIIALCGIILWVPGASGLGNQNSDRSFADIVQRTRVALKKPNVDTLKDLFAKKVVLISMVGLRSDAVSASDQKLMRTLSVGDDQINMTNAAYYLQSVVILDKMNPMTYQDKKCLNTFFETISRAVQRSSASIEIGQSLQGQEIEMGYCFGPAMEGKVNADTKWRIGFESVSGHWKIRTLIIANAE